jgi:DNA-binding response OmpR family regulator
MTDPILVVEDDAKTRALLRVYLEREGFAVQDAADGSAALALAAARPPALAILDLMLPGLDGLSLCRRLREAAPLPVIFLTARSTEDDKVAGLRQGADDYVTKPFSPRELMARVHALLRRAVPAPGPAAPEAEPVLRVGPLRLDERRRNATVAGRPVALTPREFQLLGCLAGEPGRVFSRGDLIGRVWGLDFDGLERTVDVHVMNLRRKIEALPEGEGLIQTVFGVGYRLREDRPRGRRAHD